jgi:hypothetical protein
MQRFASASYDRGAFPTLANIIDVLMNNHLAWQQQMLAYYQSCSTIATFLSCSILYSTLLCGLKLPIDASC